LFSLEPRLCSSTSSHRQVTHGIKLYPPGTPAHAASADTEKPVVAETYEEVVFTEPHEDFFRQLQAVREAPTVETEYAQYRHFAQFSDTNDVLALLEAQKFLHQQLRDAKERLKTVDDELAEVKDDLQVSVEQQQQKQQQRADPTLKITNKNKVAIVSAGDESGASKLLPPGKRSKQK
jgi:hypothetical protein